MSPLIVASLLAANTPTQPVTVAFDRATGVWNSLTAGQARLARGVDQDVSIFWDGGSLPPFDQWKLVGIHEGALATVVTRTAGNWEIETTTQVAGSTVRRSARFTWRGDGPVRVRGAQLRTPVLDPGAGARAIVPGNFPVAPKRLDGMRPGETISEVGWTRGDYGVAVLESTARGLAVAAGYRFTMDQARVSVEARKGGAVLVHGFDTLGLLQPGQAIEVGQQVLQVGSEGMATLASLAGRVGNGPPADEPVGLADTVLYEVHPWGRLESWGDGDRGNRYDRLTRLLPYYKDMGFNALWLLPVSWPPPWVYTLPDFERIAPENGTPEQLKGLVDGAHRLGIRALIDLVVYGIQPSSPEVARMPEEAWCHDEAGKRVVVWGGTVQAADTTNQAWQKRIAEVCAHWANEFGFDGTRMDCIGWGQTVNWSNPRANAPIAQGGLALNKVVRDTFRKANPRAFTLPEGGKPLVFAQSDMVFDYPLYLAMRDMTLSPDLGQWIQQLRAWLQWERIAYPSAARKGLVRFLELHDTVTAADYFGIGPSQALAAVISLMEGTPLFQQEQEIGFEKDLALWLNLRHREECLQAGDADYTLAIKGATGLLGFTRHGKRDAAVVMVNLTGRAATATALLPEALRKLPCAYDGLTGEPIDIRAGSVRVSVPAYRPRVILLKPRGVRVVAVPPLKPGGKAWQVSTPEGRLAGTERDYATKLRAGEALADALPMLKRVQAARAAGPAEVQVPDGPGPKVHVTPQLVTITSGDLVLTLARRHGGAPISLTQRGKQVLAAGGEAYSDFGLLDDRTLVSVDGETNPRLQVAREGASVTVTFAGPLRARAWNGVQTCGIAGPRMDYRLSYTLGEGPGVQVALGVTPTVDRAAAPAFYALRVPLGGFAGWSRDGQQGRAGAKTGVRLAEGTAGPLAVETAAGRWSISSTSFQKSFIIDTGGSGVLFAALFDGSRPAARAGEELAGVLNLAPAP